MKNWIMTFFGVNQVHSNAREISVGSRINTSKGWGEIVGGNLIVRLDDAPDGRLPNQKNWTFNIDKKL